MPDRGEKKSSICVQLGELKRRAHKLIFAVIVFGISIYFESLRSVQHLENAGKVLAGVQLVAIQRETKKGKLYTAKNLDGVGRTCASSSSAYSSFFLFEGPSIISFAFGALEPVSG